MGLGQLPVQAWRPGVVAYLEFPALQAQLPVGFPLAPAVTMVVTRCNRTPALGSLGM